MPAIPDHFNSYMVGVLWEGQFENTWFESYDGSPSPAQVTTAITIMKILSERLQTIDIAGHKDRDAAAGIKEENSVCPGSGAYDTVDTVRSAVVR